MDKYSWVDLGSSFLPSEVNVSYLYGQLERAEEINQNRLESWKYYFDGLKELEAEGNLELPHIPADCRHNAHMFYIKLGNREQRKAFIDWMRKNDVYCVFHYVPLHSSEGGMKYGHFHGKDIYTTKESDRLVRIPMYYGLLQEEKNRIVQSVYNFFEKDNKGVE